MSDEQLQDFRFRDTTRAPHRSQVNVRFDRFGGDVVAHTADISMEGMFLQSETPRPVGTLVQFELQLDDGQDLIQGLGDVVWLRVQSQGIERPTGMGIQFRYIDSQSRNRIRRIVGEYIDTEGAPDTASASGEAGASQPIDLGPGAAGAAAAGVDLSGQIQAEEGADVASSIPLDDAELKEIISTGASSDSADLPGLELPDAPDFLKELGAGERGQDSPLPIDSEWGIPPQDLSREPASTVESEVPPTRSSANEVLPPLDLGSDQGISPEAATQAIPTLAAGATLGAVAASLAGNKGDSSSSGEPDSPPLSPSDESQADANDILASDAVVGGLAFSAEPDGSSGDVLSIDGGDEPSSSSAADLPLLDSLAEVESSPELPEPVAPVEPPVVSEPMPTPSSEWDEFLEEKPARGLALPLLALLGFLVVFGFVFRERIMNLAGMSPSDSSASQQVAEAPASPSSEAAGVTEGDAEEPVDGASGGSAEGSGEEDTDPLATSPSVSPAATAAPSAPERSAPERPSPEQPGSVEPAAQASGATGGALELLGVGGQSDAGGTTAFLRAGREIPSSAVKFARLTGPPRYVVKVLGVSVAPPLDLETGDVSGVRAGLHETDGTPEVHLVFDLTSEDYEIEQSVEGQLIRIRFTRR